MPIAIFEGNIYCGSMEFKYVFFLVLIKLGVRILAAEGYFEPVLQCTCEPVIPEICAKEYNWTTFPNKVNKYSTENDALKEFQSFYLFPNNHLTQNCSSMLTYFLCSYYFPPCLSDLNCEGIGPCNTFCDQVRASCETQLLERNLTWPDHLNCSKFPTSASAVPYCIPTAPNAAVTVKESCEEVKQLTCASLHDDYLTHFPSKDFVTQDDADKQFNSFVPALSSNCSDMLEIFLCTSHYPVCVNGSEQIYPCKYVCEQVQQSCEPFLLKYNMSWPEFFNCSNFPNKSESACIDSTFVAPTPSTSPDSTTLSPITGKGMCEPILPEVSEICGGIHYNYTMTHFPFGQFRSQRQAIKTLKNSTEYLPYLKLVDKNCAAELKPFLCLNFFPMCFPTQPITVKKPCRSVCRKATNGCSGCVDQWPFDCNNYKVKGSCLSLDDLKQYIREVAKKTEEC